MTQDNILPCQVGSFLWRPSYNGSITLLSKWLQIPQTAGKQAGCIRYRCYLSNKKKKDLKITGSWNFGYLQKDNFARACSRVCVCVVVEDRPIVLATIQCWGDVGSILASHHWHDISPTLNVCWERTCGWVLISRKVLTAGDGFYVTGGSRHQCPSARYRVF